jgi:hypothetical protein
MVVIPAGSYKMGNEQDARIISIKMPFAVSRFTITFDQWDACAAGGGCESNTRPNDQTWGRGSRPVINVDWSDAQNYVAWLNSMTSTDSYRLLSEAEWEYAARGVTSAQAPHPDYTWGNDIGRGNANCGGCGSQWDNKQTAPVGSFKDSLIFTTLPPWLEATKVASSCARTKLRPRHVAQQPSPRFLLRCPSPCARKIAVRDDCRQHSVVPQPQYPRSP